MRLRAADVDREFVAEQLRNALNEGRLTLTEYDDRLQEAYAARTYGDLKGLLSDLPDVARRRRVRRSCRPVRFCRPSPPCPRFRRRRATDRGTGSPTSGAAG